MTRSRPIDIHKLLEQRRQIAIIWDMEDVQSVRPDLSDDQAWEVLLECEAHHDSDYGLNWNIIELMADDMFRRPPALSKDSDGGRS